MKLHETLEEDDYRYIRESQGKSTLTFYVGKSGTMKLILPFFCTVNAIWNTFPKTHKVIHQNILRFLYFNQKMYYIKYKETHTIKHTSH